MVNKSEAASHAALDAALIELIQSYQELNGSTIDELLEAPSALEFMRYVAKNRPFVARGAIAHWPAITKWDATYLKQVMGLRQINVAITPKGNADAILSGSDEEPMRFVKPLEQLEPFADFLEYVQKQEKYGTGGKHVKYAQTQNDNLRGEYQDLFSDVDSDIAWARIALQRTPEAINMVGGSVIEDIYSFHLESLRKYTAIWIGNSHSTTSLHKDNYENIFGQVVGTKSFILIPPVAVACVNEQNLAPATYRWDHQRSGTFLASLDPQGEKIPCAIWDPENPGKCTSAFSRYCQPLHIELQPGDALYLPHSWYHKVSQSGGVEGFCCAVNYWYDIDYDSSLYPALSFVREILNARTPV